MDSDAIIPLLREPGLYLHYSFTDDPKSLSATAVPTNSSTPWGFYTYETGARQSFGINRPFVFVLRYGGRRLLDIASVSRQESNALISELGAILPSGELLALKSKMEKMARRLPSRVIQSPGPLFYFLVVKSARPETREDPDFRLNLEDTTAVDPPYATQLFQRLGFEGVTDSTGSIYSSEPEQTVFFSMENLQVVAAGKNPAYDGRDTRFIP